MCAVCACIGAAAGRRQGLGARHHDGRSGFFLNFFSVDPRAMEMSVGEPCRHAAGPQTEGL